MKKVLSFKSKSEVIEEEKQNRIFFHDLINQTHGLLLFLNQKINYNKSATPEELLLLQQEVKILQKLVQDHFKYDHKNISKNFEYVPFKEFENSFNLLIKIYFTDTANIKIEKRGQIAFFENSELQDKAFVHYSNLYRMMNNLIKNMAEANATDISFIFDYGPKGLTIETKNNMQDKVSKIDITDYLSRIIKKEDGIKPKSIGLDSIHELVSLEKGHFNFEIIDNYWVNTIFIPHQFVDNKKIAA